MSGDKPIPVIKKPHCSFCGACKPDIKVLVANEKKTEHICDVCVSDCEDIIKEMPNEHKR